MSAEQKESFPGGVLRGVNAQDGGYALWTPHHGAQLQIVGDGCDPTGSYVVLRSPLYGERLFSQDMALGPFAEFGSFVNTALRTNIAARAAGVGQLTKLENSSTIPNAQDFFRVQTLELVFLYSEVFRKNRELHKLSSDDVQEHVANQLWEDWLHYALSHGLEERFAGWGSNQTLSSKMAGLVIPSALPGLVENGYFKSLDMRTGQFGMAKELDLISAAKDENGVSGIDLDKFHYTMNEILLWFSDYDDPVLTELIYTASRPDALGVTEDGELFFRDPELAIFFAKCHMLLSTEHWNDVIQRVQIFASNQAFSWALVNRKLPTIFDEDGRPIDSGHTANPICYGYGIDNDIDSALHAMVREGDEYANALQEMLKTFGMQERNRFLGNKRRIYADFLKDMHATSYPNSSGVLGKNVGYNRDFGPGSPNIEVERYEEHTGKTVPKGVLPVLSNRRSEFVLTTLKYRAIDPKVKTEKGIVRLSEQSKAYAALLRIHHEVHNAPIRARLALSRDYLRVVKQGYEATEKAFSALMKRDELPADKMRRLINGSAARAGKIAAQQGLLVQR